jgi:hypothetical protein
MKNKLLSFIDFNLIEYKTRIEDELKNVTLDAIKQNFQEQLQWINSAFDNLELSNKIIKEWFPQVLDIYIAEHGRFDSFRDENYTEDRKYFINQIYKRIEEMNPELSIDEMVTKYNFVEFLTLKLFLLYLEQFEYKYIVWADDEVPSDDE